MTEIIVLILANTTAEVIIFNYLGVFTLFIQNKGAFILTTVKNTQD